MAQSYLMKADIDFGPFTLSDLENLSYSDSPFCDNLFYGLNGRSTEDNNQSSAQISANNSDSFESDFFENWNLKKNEQNERSEINQNFDSNLVNIISGDVSEEVTIELSSDCSPPFVNVKQEYAEPTEEVVIESLDCTVSSTTKLNPGYIELSETLNTNVVTTKEIPVIPTQSQIFTLPSSLVPITVISTSKEDDSKRLNRSSLSKKTIRAHNRDETIVGHVVPSKKQCVSADNGHNADSADGNNVNFLTVAQAEVLKRQIRKIKNRESAFLSRKKKRDYITSLESKIDELERENSLLKNENIKLKEQLKSQQTNAWMPSTGLHAGVNKKVTTIMLGAMLMISFNIFQFRGSPATDVQLNDNDNNLEVLGTLHHSRSLLWYNESSSYNSKEQIDEHGTADWDKENLQMKCPIHINQTESIRMDSDLRKWIGADKYRLSDNVASFEPSVSEKERNKIDISLSELLLGGTKNHRLYSNYDHQSTDLSDKSENQLEFFNLENKQRLFDDNEALYRAMGRQRDTFYFVSFSEDHLILPAITHNITNSPKISLILPSTIINESISSLDMITMMQIDCAVTDTRLLHVKQKDIPHYFKSPSFKPNHKDNSSNSYLKNTKNKLKPLRSLQHPANYQASKGFGIHLSSNNTKK